MELEENSKRRRNYGFGNIIHAAVGISLPPKTVWCVCRGSASTGSGHLSFAPRGAASPCEYVRHAHIIGRAGAGGQAQEARSASGTRQQATATHGSVRDMLRPWRSMCCSSSKFLRTYTSSSLLLPTLPACFLLHCQELVARWKPGWSSLKSVALMTRRRSGRTPVRHPHRALKSPSEGWSGLPTPPFPSTSSGMFPFIRTPPPLAPPAASASYMPTACQHGARPSRPRPPCFVAPRRAPRPSLPSFSSLPGRGISRLNRPRSPAAPRLVRAARRGCSLRHRRSDGAARCGV